MANIIPNALEALKRNVDPLIDSIWGIVSSGNTRIGDTWEYRSGNYKFMKLKEVNKNGKYYSECS